MISTFHPISVGKPAVTILSNTHSLTEAGFASSGLFLRTDLGKILFLSGSSSRGPLTINLLQPQYDSLFALSDRTYELTKPGTFTISRSIEIDFCNTQIWSLDPIPLFGSNSSPILDRAGQVLTLVLQRKEPQVISQINELIAIFKKFTNDSPIKPTSSSLSSSELAPLLSQIGSGPGLTPLSDDFHLGLVYAIFNFQRTSQQTLLFLNDLVDHIIQTTWSQSTQISASLIEAAKDGQINENLFNAVNGLFLETLTPQECADLINSWGHSSGAGFLAGFIQGLTWLPTAA